MNFLEKKKSINKYCNIIDSILDLDINNYEKSVVFKKILNKIIKKQTGGSNPELIRGENDFIKELEQQLNDIAAKQEDNQGNIDYLINILNSLVQEFDDIIKNYDPTKIQAGIDNIINTNEQNIGIQTNTTQTNFANLYSKLKSTIDKLRLQINNPKSTDNLQKITTKLTDKANVFGTVMEAQNKSLTGGSIAINYKQTILEEINLLIDKLNLFNFIKINIGNVDNIAIVTDTDYIYIERKITQILYLVSLLEKLSEEYNILFNIFNTNLKFINLEDLWDYFFKTTNNNFDYYEKLKTEKIHFFQTIKSALLNPQQITQEIVDLFKTETTFEESKEIFNNIIQKIDNTIKYIKIIIYLFTLIFEIVTKFQKNTINIDKINNRLFTRTAISHLAFTTKIEVPIQSTSVPSSVPVQSSLSVPVPSSSSVPVPVPSSASSASSVPVQSSSVPVQSSSSSVPVTIQSSIYSIDKIEVENQKIIETFIFQLINLILVKKIPELELLKELEVINKDQIFELIDKLNNLLVQISKITGSSIVFQSIDSTSIKSLQDFYTKILLPLKGGGAAIAAPPVIRPRLDNYMEDLKISQKQLEPIRNNILQLKLLLNQDIPDKELLNFLSVLIKINKYIDDENKKGIASINRVLPLKFISIEYPTALYKGKSSASGTCDNKFTFEENGKYTFEKSKTTECNLQGSQSEPDITGYMHNALIEANKTNTTSKLIEDPVIGTRIMSQNIYNSTKSTKPISSVAMYSAVGPSGSGKSTRFFGTNRGEKGDRNGIVKDIIEQAKDKGYTIDYSYACIYGRSNSDIIEELLLFFTPKQDNSDFNIRAYKMPQPNQSSQPNQSKQSSNFSEFVGDVINTKLQKIDNAESDIISYIQGDKQFSTLNSSSSDKKTYREILQKDETIWSNITDSETVNNIFENLLEKQKRIYTIIPTKFNIESSRCHIILIIRIKFDSVYKYNVILDMAGTEDTEDMKKFFMDENDSKKMEGLMKLFIKNNSYNKFKNGEVVINSLDEALTTFPQFKAAVKKAGQGGGSIMTKKPSGEIDINDEKFKIVNSETTLQLITKILQESPYINHTIGILIWAMVALGESLKSTKTSVKDNFDDIEPLITGEVSKYICKEGTSNNTNCQIELLNGVSYSDMKQKSHMWLQIQLSLLYLNEENDNSTTELLQDIKKSDQSFTGPITRKQIFEIIKQGLNPEISIDGIKFKLITLLLLDEDNSLFFTDLKNKLGAVKTQNNNLIYDRLNFSYSNSKFLLSNSKEINNLTEIERKIKELKDKIDAIITKITKSNSNYNLIQSWSILETLETSDKLSTFIEQIFTTKILQEFQQIPLPNYSIILKYKTSETEYVVWNEYINIKGKNFTTVNPLTGNFKLAILHDGAYFIKAELMKKMKEDTDKTELSKLSKERNEEISKKNNIQRLYPLVPPTGFISFCQQMHVDYISNSTTGQDKYDLQIHFESKSSIIFQKLSKEVLLYKAIKNDTTLEQDYDNNIAVLNMQRIKDGRCGAASFYFISTWTGQASKYKMMKKVLELVNIFYKAGNIEAAKLN